MLQSLFRIMIYREDYILFLKLPLTFFSLFSFVIKGEGQAGERGFDLLWCSPSGAAVCSLKGPALHNIDDGVNGPPTLQSGAVGLPV